MAAFCAQCGWKLPTNARFCGQCGIKIASLTPEPAVAVVATPPAPAATNDEFFETVLRAPTVATPAQPSAGVRPKSPVTEVDDSELAELDPMATILRSAPSPTTPSPAEASANPEPVRSDALSTPAQTPTPSEPTADPFRTIRPTGPIADLLVAELSGGTAPGEKPVVTEAESAPATASAVDPNQDPMRTIMRGDDLVYVDALVAELRPRPSADRL